MRLLHAWGNRSSFPTTSREPPIAPWLFGGLLSDERNKMIGTTSLRKGVELQLWDRQDLEQWAFQFKLGLRKSSCRCGSTTCESPIEASWQHPIILFAVSMNASPSWRTSCLGDGNWSVLPFQSSHSQTMREVTCFFYLQLLLCLSLLLCQAWKCEKDVASSMHQQGDITHIHLSAEFQLAMAIMDHSGSLWIIVTISPLLTVYDRKCQVLSASKVPNLCFNLQEEAVQSPMAEVSQLLSLVGNMTALTTLEDEARSLQGLYRIRPWRFFLSWNLNKTKKLQESNKLKSLKAPWSRRIWVCGYLEVGAVVVFRSMCSWMTLWWTNCSPLPRSMVAKFPSMGGSLHNGCTMFSQETLGMELLPKFCWGKCETSFEHSIFM